MKRLFLVIAIALYACMANAQEVRFGIEADLDITKLHGSKSSINNSKSTLGFGIGGVVRLKMNNNIVLSSGANIGVKNGKFSVLSKYYNNETQALGWEFPEVRYQVVSLEIPLKIGYEFNIKNSLTLTPMVGIYWEHALKSLKKDVTIGESGYKQQWDCMKDLDYNNYHLDALKRDGLGIAIGVDTRIKSHYTIGLGYKFDLTKKSSQFGLKDSGLQLRLGYLW